jgi:hypothetical protein
MSTKEEGSDFINAAVVVGFTRRAVLARVGIRSRRRIVMRKGGWSAERFSDPAKNGGKRIAGAMRPRDQWRY